MYRQRTGASLLEVILMMVILAIVATTGSFISQGWSGDRVADEMAETIEQTLDTAREIAVRNRTSVAVTCEQANGRWQMEITEEAGPLRKEQPAKIIDLGNQITFSRSKSTVVFAADSSVSGSLNWEFKSTTDSKAISVNPKDGEVSVKP